MKIHTTRTKLQYIKSKQWTQVAMSKKYELNYFKNQYSLHVTPSFHPFIFSLHIFFLIDRKKFNSYIMYKPFWFISSNNYPLHMTTSLTSPKWKFAPAGTRNGLLLFTIVSFLSRVQRKQPLYRYKVCVRYTLSRPTCGITLGMFLLYYCVI